MCNMYSDTSRPKKRTIEEEYKGCRTRAKQMIQEQQGEVEVYV